MALVSPGCSSHPQLSPDAVAGDCSGQTGRLEVLQGTGMASGSSAFWEQTEEQLSPGAHVGPPNSCGKSWKWRHTLAAPQMTAGWRQYTRVQSVPLDCPWAAQRPVSIRDTQLLASCRGCFERDWGCPGRTFSPAQRSPKGDTPTEPDFSRAAGGSLSTTAEQLIKSHRKKQT